MEEETAKTLQGGWLRTSDIGNMDEYDNVYWLARKTDVIKSCGRTIYPRLIEEVLYGHPDISKVAVVGLPDERLGEVPKAFVLL